jgi:DNA mismatch repair ATPase MutL
MKTFMGIIWAVAIVLSTPLAGQETAPDKENQKQEEQKKQAPSNRKREAQPQEKPKPKPEQAPVTSQQKQQPNNRSQQSTRPARGNGRRIPAEKFQSNFGNQHPFRVVNLESGRRFRHAGFVFEIVEPWPADWSFDDDCFIEQDADDYYLVNTFHPGFRILLIVIEG